MGDGVQGMHSVIAGLDRAERQEGGGALVDIIAERQADIRADEEMPEMGDVAINAPRQRKQHHQHQRIDGGMRRRIAIDRAGRADEVKDLVDRVDEQNRGDGEIDIFGDPERDLGIAGR